MKGKKNQKGHTTQKNEIPKIHIAKNLDRKISSQNSIFGNEEENENKKNEESSNSKQIKSNSNNENLLSIKLEKQRRKSKADSNYAININNINDNNLKLLSLSKRNTNKIYEQGEVNINNCNTNIKDENENDQNKENIISKINLKRSSIYCCFLFIRKRKTIENILLDEGMNVIRENLDIFNIFDKMYRSEKIHLKLINQEIFEMSDGCKKMLLSKYNKKNKI